MTEKELRTYLPKRFLDKAKVTKDSKISHTALLLLCKE